MSNKAPLEQLSLCALQNLAGEMSDIIEGGGDEHAVRYARLIERQAHAEISRRAKGSAEQVAT